MLAGVEVEDKEEPQEEESDVSELTIDIIEEWNQPPSKGGLSAVDIRAKAKKYGITATKKDDICKALIKMAKKSGSKKASKESKPKAIKESKTGQCAYVLTRGDNKGTRCNTKTKGGEEFCSKHKNSKPQKKAASTKPSIVRHKTKDGKNHWVLADEKSLVVVSAANPKVKGYIAKGVYIEKTPAKIKKLAEQHKLKVKA